MEEADLLKERLQAITKKRKVQEDIASKRLEIDKEKLKLQQLKKKYARDLWLMGDMTVKAAQEEQKILDLIQQTDALQSYISRIEKEIETLEMEELSISTNEGLVLNRLKTVEKSTADIIKAANENFKSEPTRVYPGIPDYETSYTPSYTKKQPSVRQETQNDKQKPAMFAMEINVQKDLRTGESRVLSTCKVPAQELQQRGIKVFDDGRKSVYALHGTLDQPEANGVDELSPTEVEELLKQAAAKGKKPQEQMNPVCRQNYQNSQSEWAELEYNQKSIQYSYQELHKSPHMFHNYSDQREDDEMYGEETISDPNQFYDVNRDGRARSQHADSAVNSCPPLSYREDLSTPNTLPSDEPVTMIFMGYQEADEDAHSYEGSVQAELVLIEDGEEEACIRDFQRNACLFSN